MEDWVRKIVVDGRKRRGIPLEAKLLNGNYYLYRSTSKYDRVTKKAVKVSQYIGRITDKGIIEKEESERSVFEYGNSALVYSLSTDIKERLRRYFPERWEDIYVLSVVRLIDPVPLRYVKDRWKKLFVPSR